MHRNELLQLVVLNIMSNSFKCRIQEGFWLLLFFVILVLLFLIPLIQVGYIKTINSIRYYGLFLELVGMLFVIKSLKDKFLLFEGYGLGKFLWNWIRGLFKKQKPTIANIEGTAEGRADAEADATVIKNLHGAELGEVVDYFQNEINRLDQKIVEIKRIGKIQKLELENEIAKLQSNLSRKIDKTELLVKDVNASNIWREMFGVGCIFLGLICGTAPELINWKGY